jgi:ABC-type transport system involved in cytochrome c biogenesis permease subunit
MPTGHDKAVRVFVDVPNVGPILFAAALLYVVAFVLYVGSLRRKEDLGASGPAFWTTAAATAVLAVGLIVLAVQISSGAPVAIPPVDGQLQGDLKGPYRLAFNGNPDAIGLLGLTLVASVIILLVTRFQNQLTLDLPDAKKLDDIIYRVITVGFPFLSVGVVMGAVWAHYSWGRYWGWDPKETWALITWLVYAVYLHTRITLGWTGKPGAFIAVAGFAVVIFCYLGVNLGLTGEGLHSYGAG